MNKLNARMAELEMSMTDLAETIGIHVSTLYRKMRAPECLYLWEVKKIKEALHLSQKQLVEIFFDD